MAIEDAKAKLNGLSVSDESTTTEEEEEFVVPTKIEEAGRKYCCAKCYRSYGRVTHVALEKRVTLEPNALVSGRNGRKDQLYYTNRYPG